jgi:plasmid stabilization system protein ParE
MSIYTLGEAAALDLDAIWEFIAQDNIPAADRWIDKLFNAFETVSRDRP